MAGKQPPAVESITGWWKEQFMEQLASGDGVDRINDFSGTGTAGDFVQATGANQPKFTTNVRWGKPAYRFGVGGGTHFMTGPDFDTLVNNGKATVMVAIYITDVSAEQYIICDQTGIDARIAIVILPESVPGAGDASIRVRLVDSGGVNQIDIGDNPNHPFHVTTPAWHVVALMHSGGQLRAYLDDPLYFTFIACGNSLGLDSARIGADPTGGRPLLDAYIGEIITSDVGWSDKNVSTIFGYMANRWLDRGDPLARMRDAASRRLNRFERPRPRHTIHLPLSFLGSAELYTPHAITHGYLPTATGQGAGFERWQRGVVVPVERRWNLDEYRLELTLEDQRGLSHLYRETGVATRSGDPRREGVQISGVSPYRFPAMGTSSAWVLSAGVGSSGSGLVIEVPAGVEAADAEGIVTEPASVNLLLRSTFQSQLSGLTPNGGGVNGSDIIADPTSDLTQPGLFHPDVTEWCARFIAGTPHAADLYLQWPLTTGDFVIPADSVLCFSMDQTELTGPLGDPLAWALQNNVDSKWWDDTNETWSVTLVWNLGTAGYARHASNPILWPGSSGQALVYVGYPSGGTSGRLSRLFHVQLDVWGFPTGRIVQDSAFFGTRSARAVEFHEWQS